MPLRRSATVLFASCLLAALSQAEESENLDRGEIRPIWDCESTAGIDGLSLETHLVKQGDAAVRWTKHPEFPRIAIPHVPHDWSGYQLLRFWIHNAEIVPARFMVLVNSENPTTEGSDYWGFGIQLDFTGWREVILPIGRQGGTREPRGWDQIDSLVFTASGWGNTPHPDADVVIDNIRLEVDPPEPGPRMTDAEFFENLDLTQPKLRAVERAVRAGDLARAKSLLLEHMRNRLQPRWWFDWRDRPERGELITGGSDGWDYFAANLKVDWTGWRLITLPLTGWTRSRKPIGWHCINHLSFSSTYGDRTPSSNTVLVLDDIQLTGETPCSLGSFEEAADFDRWKSLVPTRRFVKSGKQAALWSDLPIRSGIRLSDVPRDWRRYDALQFWAYSAAPTGDIITLTADSDTPASVSQAASVMHHLHAGFHVGDDIDWNINKYSPDDPAFTREWTYNLNRFADWQTLGRAYWDSGDERYAREWIAQMRDWVEDNRYPLFGTGNDTLTWRTIEAGIRTARPWPDSLYYFLGSPSLKPDDLVTFLKSWMEHAHHLMRITVEHPEHGGNWVTMECNGLGHLGILLPECQDAPLWFQTAVDRMTMELDRQVYPDGAQKELTSGYHQVARRNFVQLLKIAIHNDIQLPAEYLERLERLYEYNLKAMTPDGHLPPLNDAGYTAVLDSLQEGADLFARQDFLWAASRGVQGEAPAYTSIAFPYAGQYVMRSGWERDDRYLLFESGPFGIGHQHEDKLSLFIFAYNRPLLTEAGTYSYDRSKYRRYVLGTWAHNTVLVDGEQQHRRGLNDTYATDAPLNNYWTHNPVFDAADGVYDDGYGANREIDVQHERTVVFVRPDYWVVLDRFHAVGEHRYDVLWHLNNDAAASDPDSLAGWGTDPQIANLMVTPATTENTELEIVTGRDEPVLGFAPAKTRKPIPVLDYKVQGEGLVSRAWVLTPYPHQRPTISATLTEHDNWTIVTVHRDGGTDYVGVAPRGQVQSLKTDSLELSGHLAVIRRSASGEITAAEAD